MKTALPFVPFSLLAASVAAADTSPTEQMIVTGFRTEHSVLESPAAVSVITREEIEQSGALTVADVLRARAGLQVRDLIGDGGRGVVVSMRGFGENAANNTLILVDGRRLNNPTLGSPDLNTVALGDIERIEILQGGGGVLFGDQAVGGVINIVTRSTDEGSIAVEGGGGSEDFRSGSLSASGRLANGLGGRLSAEHRESDNYRDNNESDYDNVLGLVEYRTDVARLFAEAQYTDDELQLPGALYQTEVDADRRQSTVAHIGDFANQETTTWRTGGRYAFNRTWSAEFEYSERDMDGDGSSYSTPNSTEMRLRTASPRLLGEFETGSGNALLTLGLDWTDSDYLLEFFGLFPFTTDSAQEMQDVYAQLVYPLTRTIQVSAGARRSEVDDDNRVMDTQNSDSETVTSASIAWQFHDGMRLLLRRDEVLRYANVDENGYVEVDQNGNSLGFLQPQTGASLEAGLEWYGKRLSGRAMLFDLELQDEILFDPSAIGPGAIFGAFGANVNLDTNRTGLLMETRWQAAEWLSVAASYTYTEAEISEGTFDGNEVPYVAPHSGSLSATWTIGRGFTLFGEYAYTGSRYAAGDSANEFGKVDSEGLVNAALRWQGEHLQASLRANNLLDEEYDTYTQEIYGRSMYPAPERAVFLSVGYSL